jgi:hypothetical protein
MLRFFRPAPRPREIYFHEDDYCQQQLLPAEAIEHVEKELKNVREFAAGHRAPGGIGWTDIYVRKDAPVELRVLKITRQQFGEIVSAILPPFDIVYTGYSSHRGRCNATAAWGTSTRCAIFIDWDDADIVTNCWTEFSAQDEPSILRASQAIAALGKAHPLVYVDWAWDYVCEASNDEAFAALLREKLKTIAERIRTSGGPPHTLS